MKSTPGVARPTDHPTFARASVTFASDHRASTSSRPPARARPVSPPTRPSPVDAIAPIVFPHRPSRAFAPARRRPIASHRSLAHPLGDGSSDRAASSIALANASASALRYRLSVRVRVRARAPSRASSRAPSASRIDLRAAIGDRRAARREVARRVARARTRPNIATRERRRASDARARARESERGARANAARLRARTATARERGATRANATRRATVGCGRWTFEFIVERVRRERRA